MILDRLEHIDRYTSLGERMTAALRYLRDTRLEELEEGRHEIDGHSYVLAQSYETRDPKDAQFESHRKYIDIQIVVSGKELLGWASLDSVTPAGAYSEESDAQLYDGELVGAVALEPGWFVILMPEDGHMPSCHLGEKSSVRKTVAKVPVGQ